METRGWRVFGWCAAAIGCADLTPLRGRRPNHCQMAARVFASGDIYEAGDRLKGIRVREGGPTRPSFVV